MIISTGMEVKKELADPKLLRKAKTVADIAAELKMTSKARKVFEIIMDTLQDHFADKDEYYGVAGELLITPLKGPSGETEAPP